MKAAKKYSYIIVSRGHVVATAASRSTAEYTAEAFADAVIYRTDRMFTCSGRVKDPVAFTAAKIAAVNEWTRVQAARARDVLLS